MTAHFGPIGWATLATGLVLFSVGLALAIGRGIKLGDRQIVSPEPDATWLDDQPHEVDTAALIDAEFVAIISAHWMWPFDREEADQ